MGEDKKNSILGDMAIQCLQDSERWFGDTGTTRSVSYMALCMAGEVGEFCNIVKKIERKSLSIQDSKTRVQLASELTDVFVYMLNIAGILGIDLAKSYDMVRTNNERRFSDERRKREAGSH
jgi:NTP pyrophosphatase (non-canonical NTP hydrolase)